MNSVASIRRFDHQILGPIARRIRRRFFRFFNPQLSRSLSLINRKSQPF